jgi:hypothetical protein
MASLFWFCVVFVAYAYFGYPIVLFLAARLFGTAARRAPITPTVSFIITARNEAQRIRAKIENTLALDYPASLIEVIVASDHSDDDTDAIVSEFGERGVRLVRSPERRGKEFAQSLAIQVARGEVIVFSDVATTLDRNGVRNIVQSFADASVGCVSSVDRVIGSDGAPGGEGAYVRYEMFLRSLESRIGSVVGLSGSFFAARRQACTPWPVDLPSDFNTLLNCVRLGLRGVSNETAVGTYPDLAEPRAEYRRKTRTVSRGLISLGRNLQLLNVFRFGFSSFQLLSHKACRWLVPFAMAGALVSAIVLAWHSPTYAVFAAAQALAYAASALAIGTQARVTGIWRVIPFFVLVNLSILTAWSEVLRGRRAVTWQPSRR